MNKLKNMFFEYNYVDVVGEPMKISNKSKVISDIDCYACKYVGNVISEAGNEGTVFNISLSLTPPQNLIEKIGSAYIENDEGYILKIDSNDIYIYSVSERGLMYGVATLRRLMHVGELKEILLFDCPDKKVRGYRVYLPGKNSLDAFKEMIDTLVYYKYNSVIMEVGGAMEYKRHPEINEKWVEFCTQVNSIPGEANRIQRETPQLKWAKDSIHAENGGGGYISQDDVRDIVAYCRERHIEVIPEVPSLSHSDYIVMAHPELNERVYDMYPDTYCPSDPKSYEILFDILDEVVDVFKPNYLNIGHDEVYSIALCDKCKGKDPIDLFVEDIKKINDYLHTKGVRAMMWCDKLFNAFVDGIPVGGALREEFGIPEMYQSREKIPNDIILLNWYWSLCDPDEERDLVTKYGFDMVYGNYNGLEHKNYRERQQYVDGGFASNWGYMEEKYMQRNKQYFALVTTAYVFWSNTYTNDMKDTLLKACEQELHNRYLTTIGNDYIELIHTTDILKEENYFWCGWYIYDEEWLLGNYKITYEDGETAYLPVSYGYNITNCNQTPEVDNYYRALGACMPIEKDGKRYYKTAYTNPYPGKKIVDIVFESEGENKVELLSESVKLISKTAL